MANRVSSTVDGLPAQFISSLRVLFDILDCSKTGFIELSELEASWEDGSIDGLPKGVVGALRKVTPPNGKLSFELFVAGLKIALLRHRSELFLPKDSRRENDDGKLNHHQKGFKRDHQTLSTGALQGSAGSGSKHGIQTRTNSLPILQNRPKDSAQYLSNGQLEPPSNWGNMNEFKRTVGVAPSSNHKDRKPGDGRSSIASASALDFFGKTYSKEDELPAQRGTNRRRETRRHTLANGVDHNMVRRLSQLEHEKKTLTGGLEMVAQATDWYQEQLRLLDDKMKSVARMDHGYGEQSVEAGEERLKMLSVRIQELNQQLNAIIDSSHKGFPLHMNLAVVPQSPQKHDSQDKVNMINMLKAQNRMLTKEVSEKSEKIAQLDKEKTQLIKKMFEATSEKQRPSYDDTTFI